MKKKLTQIISLTLVLSLLFSSSPLFYQVYGKCDDDDVQCKLKKKAKKGCSQADDVRDCQEKRAEAQRKIGEERASRQAGTQPAAETTNPEIAGDLVWNACKQSGGSDDDCGAKARDTYLKVEKSNPVDPFTKQQHLARDRLRTAALRAAGGSEALSWKQAERIRQESDLATAPLLKAEHQDTFDQALTNQAGRQLTPEEMEAFLQTDEYRQFANNYYQQNQNQFELATTDERKLAELGENLLDKAAVTKFIKEKLEVESKSESESGSESGVEEIPAQDEQEVKQKPTLEESRAKSFFQGLGLAKEFKSEQQRIAEEQQLLKDQNLSPPISPQQQRATAIPPAVRSFLGATPDEEDLSSLPSGLQEKIYHSQELVEKGLISEQEYNRRINEYHYDYSQLLSRPEMEDPAVVLAQLEEISQIMETETLPERLDQETATVIATQMAASTLRSSDGDELPDVYERFGAQNGYNFDPDKADPKYAGRGRVDPKYLQFLDAAQRAGVYHPQTGWLDPTSLTAAEIKEFQRQLYYVKNPFRILDVGLPMIPIFGAGIPMASLTHARWADEDLEDIWGPYRLFDKPDAATLMRLTQIENDWEGLVVAANQHGIDLSQINRDQMVAYLKAAYPGANPRIPQSRLGTGNLQREDNVRVPGLSQAELNQLKTAEEQLLGFFNQAQESEEFTYAQATHTNFALEFGAYAATDFLLGELGTRAAGKVFGPAFNRVKDFFGNKFSSFSSFLIGQEAAEGLARAAQEAGSQVPQLSPDRILVPAVTDQVVVAPAESTIGQAIGQAAEEGISTPNFARRVLTNIQEAVPALPANLPRRAQTTINDITQGLSTAHRSITDAMLEQNLPGRAAQTINDFTDEGISAFKSARERALVFVSENPNLGKLVPERFWGEVSEEIVEEFSEDSLLLGKNWKPDPGVDVQNIPRSFGGIPAEEMTKGVSALKAGDVDEAISKFQFIHDRQALVGAGGSLSVPEEISILNESNLRAAYYKKLGIENLPDELHLFTGTTSLPDVEVSGLRASTVATGGQTAVGSGLYTTTYPQYAMEYAGFGIKPMGSYQEGASALIHITISNPPKTIPTVNSREIFEYALKKTWDNFPHLAYQPRESVLRELAENAEVRAFYTNFYDGEIARLTHDAPVVFLNVGDVTTVGVPWVGAFDEILIRDASVLQGAKITVYDPLAISYDPSKFKPLEVAIDINTGSFDSINRTPLSGRPEPIISSLPLSQKAAQRIKEVVDNFTGLFDRVTSRGEVAITEELSQRFTGEEITTAKDILERFATTDPRSRPPGLLTDIAEANKMIDDFQAQTGVEIMIQRDDFREVIGRSLNMIPDEVRSKSDLQKIFINRGDAGGYFFGEPGVYTSDKNLNIYSFVNFIERVEVIDRKNPMYFLDTFFHEYGHTLESGVLGGLSDSDRGVLETAIRVIHGRGASLETSLGKTPRGVDLTQNYADFNALYVVHGDELRDQIVNQQAPILHEAYQTLYDHFKDLYGGKEFSGADLEWLSKAQVNLDNFVIGENEKTIALAGLYAYIDPLSFSRREIERRVGMGYDEWFNSQPISYRASIIIRATAERVNSSVNSIISKVKSRLLLFHLKPQPVYAQETEKNILVNSSLYKKMVIIEDLDRLIQEDPDLTLDEALVVMSKYETIDPRIEKEGNKVSITTGEGGFAQYSLPSAYYKLEANPIEGYAITKPAAGVNLKTAENALIEIGIREGNGQVVTSKETQKEKESGFGKLLENLRSLLPSLTQKAYAEPLGASSDDVLGKKTFGELLEEVQTGEPVGEDKTQGTITLSLYHDTNGNGTKEEGEENLSWAGLTITLTKETKEVAYTLLDGWNFVSFPLIPQSFSTASELITEAARQGAYITTVARWNNSQWEEYVQRGDQAFGQDFPIEPGVAYMLRNHIHLKTWQVSGFEITSPIPLELKTGFNGVGIPYSQEEHTASTTLDGINLVKGGKLTPESENANLISRYQSGTWDVFVKRIYAEEEIEEYGHNFPITPIEGYFIRVKEKADWTP